MEILSNIISVANGFLWSNGMLMLCFGGGLLFTIVLGIPQIRMLPEMVKLLFNGQKSEEGLSSFQAFCLAIAGRVGVGNIAGVATAIAMGGPGALFWMWMVAIFGSATTFVECSLSQLHKRVINGEYRGGWSFYIGDSCKWLGGGSQQLYSHLQCLSHSQAFTLTILLPASQMHSGFLRLSSEF